VAFAAGVASGIGYERRHVSSMASGAADGHGAMQHLTTTLDLDSAQQAAISAILARHQPEVDAAWHAMRPHVTATLESTSNEILSALRPDQAEKFRRMIESRHPAGHR
jgi:hypothetical protein